MPPIDPALPKRKVRRVKSGSRPETAGNPNVARTKVRRVRPAPTPKPTQTQIRSAHAQEGGYRSQGQAVEREANRQNVTAGNDYHGPNDVYTDAQRRKAAPASSRNIRESRLKFIRARNLANHKALMLSVLTQGRSGSGTGRPGSRSASILDSTSPFGVVGSRGVRGAAEALVESPGPTLKHTATGLGESLAGIPAGLLSASVDTVKGIEEGHPFKGAKSAASKYLKDAERRYGPLLREGGEHAFAERLKREGGAAEILDAMTFAPAAVGAVGKLTKDLALAGKLGKPLERIASERPALRISGGEARPQTPHRNLAVAVGQHALDVARERKTRRIVRKARAKGTPVDVLDATVQPGEVVPLVRRKVRHTQHREVAKEKGRSLQAMKREQTEEVGHGTNRNIAKLSKRERKAFKYALQLGIHDPETARRVLSRHLTQARKLRTGMARQAGEEEALRSEIATVEDRLSKMTPGTAPYKRVAAEAEALYKNLDEVRAGMFTVPRVLRATNDELPVMADLLQHADEAFTPKLAAIVREEEARGRRLAEGDPGLSSTQAALRRYAQQAHVLGVIRKEGESDAAFIRRVKQEAAAHGLKRPGYFPSQARPRVRFSDYALGGSKAIQTDHRYTGKLFREGREDTRAEVLSQGLARNIKRRHNWNLIARTVDKHAFDWSRDKTVGELLNELDRRGIDHNSVALWNPGRFRAAAQRVAHADNEIERTGGEEPVAAGITEAVDESATTLGKLATRPDEFQKSKGFLLIPRAVFDEIHADTRPSGKVGRTFDVLKGKQARLLLGTSPKWLAFQVASNALLTGLAGVGPADFVKAQAWWHGLSKDEQRAIDPYLGTGRFDHSIDQVKLGAAANGSLINAYRAFKESAFFNRPRKVLRGGTVKSLNPLDILFRADRAQNDAFRRAVLYNRAKREAYRRMGQSAGRVLERERHVTNLLTLGPKEQIRAVLRDHHQLEALADDVNNFLGDWLTYTAKERRTLGRAVMFYGWLRFSLRFVFFTMPTQHPVIASIVAQLGRLQEQELHDLLGGDVLPWQLGKFYFTHDGKLESINLASANPASNALTEFRTPKDVLNFLPPIAVAALNQIADKNIFLDRDLLVHGEEKGRRAEDYSLSDRAKVFANQGILSLIAPYRAWMDAATRGRPQSDDAFPFAQQPIHYSDPDKELGAIRAMGIEGSPGEIVARDLLPFIAKPEHAKESAALSSTYDELTKVTNRMARMRKNGTAEDKAGGGYMSAEYQGLVDRQKKLEARINELQARGKPAKRPKAVRLTRRPLTPEQEFEKQFQESQKNPMKQFEREFQREQARQSIINGD